MSMIPPMIHHHPPDDWLLDHVTGALTGPWSVLLASHLTVCPACRAQARRYERLGGALLARLTPEPVTAGTPADDNPRPTGPEIGPTGPGDPVFPKPLRAAVGHASGAVPWRTVLPGVESYDLTGGGGQAVARLLRIAPGRSVPQHTHKGQEATAVLSGFYADGTGRYGPGDVAVADPGVNHKPVADPDGVCICFTVSEAPMHLTGPLGRFLNFLPLI